MLLKRIILLFLINLLIATNAFAFQNCQSKYDNDKRSLPSLRGMCNVCHISPSGTGPQNDFGRAFANAGFMITDDLVARFPNFFQKPKEESLPSEGSGSSSSGEQLQLQIKRIKPKSVKINIQSMAAIIGKNFVNGAKTFIDGNEVITTFKSNVKLVIDFVLNTVGIHEIKVQNPDGQESNTVNVKGK